MNNFNNRCIITHANHPNGSSVRKYPFRTTQDILPSVSSVSVTEGKRIVQRYRYKKTDKRKSSPKQMLIILPSHSQKRQYDSSHSRNESPLMNIEQRVQSLPNKDEQDNIKMDEIIAPIHRKQFKQSKKTPYKLPRLKDSEETVLHNGQRKTNPLINDKKLIMVGQESKNNADGNKSIQSIKHSRITRQIFSFKHRFHNNSIGRIQKQCGKNSFYPMGEEQHLFNLFNIQSLDPHQNQILHQTSISLHKENRRSTQPNLQTQESVQKDFLTDSKQLILLLGVNTLGKSDNPEVEVNIQPRHSKFRLKEMVPLKSTNKIVKPRVKIFKIPFQTFHYRDLLWKVNFTNERFVEPPLEYEHRLKIYVGKGNNSCMVRGLINRRYWFGVTDKIEDANFVWTQLKMLDYFKIQKAGQQSLTRLSQESEYQQNSLQTVSDTLKYKSYWQRFTKFQQNGDERLLSRNKYFKSLITIKPQQIKYGKMHNHFKHNYVIGNKRALLHTMCRYYQGIGKNPFDFIPLSFHVVQGLEDPNFLLFQKYFYKRSKEIRKQVQNKLNMWIIKPGEYTNRGYGIKICHGIREIKEIVKNKGRWDNGSPKTNIIQSYIQNPFLYKRRKVDIRHYILVTCINGHRKGYWYLDGYIRTSSSEYKANVSSSSVHLTNQAIQRYLPDYGKYEKGNKLSYEEIDRYIKKRYNNKGFFTDVYPQMKSMGMDVIKASINYMDPEKLENNFQVFGLDFMMDSDLKLWLIQVNSNPCLELSCPLLSKIVPNFIENVLQVTLDTMFPPPVRYSPKIPRYLANMQKASRLQLVFDSRVEDGLSGDPTILDNRMLLLEDDIFDSDGSEWQED